MMKNDKNRQSFIVKLVFYTLSALVAAAFLWCFGEQRSTRGAFGQAFSVDAGTASDDISEAGIATMASFDEALQTLGAKAQDENVYLLPVANGLEDARLVLSVKDGCVCAFTLELVSQEKPQAPSANATVIEQKHYELSLACYEVQVSWLEESLLCLAHCLDVQQELTYAELDKLLLSAKAGVFSGKDKNVRAGRFVCSVSFDATQTLPVAHISMLADNE